MLKRVKVEKRVKPDERFFIIFVLRTHNILSLLKLFRGVLNNSVSVSDSTASSVRVVMNGTLEGIRKEELKFCSKCYPCIYFEVN
jgi:hypothetical protein